MKKFLYYFFAFMAILPMSLAMTSCGDDDDDDDDGVTNNSQIVGTWRALDYDHFYSNVTITFNSDGTGSATMNHEGAFISYKHAQFEYKMKGNKVTAKGSMAAANSDGDVDTYDFNVTYELSGSTLYVKSGSTWFGDPECVSSYTKY